MPLTTYTQALQISWALQGTTTSGFAAPTQSGNLPFALAANVATWNQIYANTLSIPASTTTSLVLTGLTNLVGESFSFAHVLGICVVPSVAASIKFGPGASNPLQWFFDDLTATVQVDAGGIFVWGDPSSSSGTAVSGTHKQLDFTNLSGSVTASVQVIILGSTT